TLWLVLLLPLATAWMSMPAAAGGFSLGEVSPASGEAALRASDAGAPFVLDDAPDWAVRVALVTWSIWCAAWMMRAVRSLVALRRFRRRSEPMSAIRELNLPLWQSRRGIGRAATLRASNDVATAGVFGFNPPIIAISPAALDTLSDADL